MIYLLFRWLGYDRPWAPASTPFRGLMAVLAAFVVVWVLGPVVIRRLKALKIKDRSEFDHEKLNALAGGKNVPTMGGVLIVGAIFLVVMLLADITNFYIHMALVCLVWLAALGAVDDWFKLTAKHRHGTRSGLRTWEKLVFQTALGALLAIFILREGRANLERDWLEVNETPRPYFNVLNIPFYKGGRIGEYHGVRLPTPVFALLTVIVIVGTSNAVNLTDGMDGLASGCMSLTGAAFLALTAVVGNEVLSRQLLLYPIRGADELAVVCGALVGACLGFLWYNCYPAQVFMGDTGSLALGGLIGYVAIVLRLETMLFIVGGIFVIEAVSVILQVGYYKLTGGKRLFRVAPIHHHFHLGGWTETQVVMRFWLLAALFAAFALATLKLR